MTMTLSTAAAKPAQQNTAGLFPNANPAANQLDQLDQLSMADAAAAPPAAAAVDGAALFAQLLNLAQQIELAPPAADDAATADSGDGAAATTPDAGTASAAAAPDQGAMMNAMAAPLLNLAMALPFAAGATTPAGNAASATVQDQPRVDGMSARLASGSNISLNLNIANQQPGGTAPATAIATAIAPAAATGGGAGATAAPATPGDSAIEASASGAAPTAPTSPAAPAAQAAAASALAAAAPSANSAAPARAGNAGKDAERAPASGHFASAATAAAGAKDDGGGSGLRLAAAPAGNGVNGAYTPAAPAAAPLADSVKLAGSAEQWQQPLREALGERLQLQLQRNNDHAVIRLEPPNMGRIEISIRHSAGALQVNLSASNSEVLRQLNNIGDSVRQDLSQRSFGEVAVNVSASAGPRGQAMAEGDGRGGRQGQQDQGRAPGRALSDDEAAAATFAMLTEQE
ncbi:flagellar hook-length control protein FliK [Rugamonas sp. DEMB1]|uniref:flagellar hook-length control protein FliK n=1 Tax=Rugamonas sp. DEMB1 TaxID=3039386 RepID=UPI0024484AA4|nr:flagellar hook-length control protein FliK [Rugamonas sp. DEMB1]WGG48366.1 flagellar hook-length control protein FliK [Rugamonas sp. DEMB1]